MHFWVYDEATASAVIKLKKGQYRIVDPSGLLKFGERDIHTFSHFQLIVENEFFEAAGKSFTRMVATITEKKLFIVLGLTRAILSTKNESVDEINYKLIEQFSGEQKVYYSFDEAEDDKNNLYPMEYLNSLNVNEIAVGQHVGKRVFLPRIPLCPSDDEVFPFKLKRKQFPIQLSFSITINKAQGQTIPNVGVFLPKSVFSHGQLYVMLSREISRVNTKVLVKPEKMFDNDGIYTSNIVYKEVLCD
ncbi:uncharacterized protein LOC111886186 [Lactuca sativa]|uniref:uncharacterized protein LOC111886186 n=1 Tax=Lactuca sativa TaxID=4236 RepID=UPI000CD90E43|nr:uncharacterized protein LOC111886186 [Lactuca sativa]